MHLASALYALLLTVTHPAMTKDLTITVSTPEHDYRNVPVSATIDAPADFAGVALFDKDTPVPAQSRLIGGGKAEVIWIVPELRRGQSHTYRLAYERVSRPVPTSGVIIDKAPDGSLDIRIDNELFTRYDTHTGPNKPYFYPIFGPGEKRMARRYPIEKIEGESHDHTHHRGLWFTHGSVNGEDYWSEEPKSAKSVNTGYEEVVSGPVCGYFRARTDWISFEGKKIAEDIREVRIYDLPDGRLMDFDVTIRPVDGPLVFGDTKEGSFGIRVPDSIRADKGAGHIEMSTGVKDKETWGKRAEWCDYYGPVDGETQGIAILDHPSNLRHPTTWHVRDYGLFAVNPFGLHDFENDKANPHKGDYTVPAGQSLTFRYRILFHKGTTAEARIADLWTAYADPPKVGVK